MSDEKQSLYRQLREQVGNFVVTIVIFLKGVAIIVIFAWVISKTPWLCDQIGIDRSNHAVDILMQAGDVGSVTYGIISIVKDLMAAFRGE